VHNGPAYPAGPCDCGVAQELDYKVALNEWLDKTEWVQEKINSGHLGARYLGMHRADVLRDLAYQNTVTGKAPAQPAQEPEYWNVIDPAGNIVASETDAIRGWARIAGSYKPTVEGLLGFHDQGWRVLPKVAPPAAQPAQEPVREALKLALEALESGEKMQYGRVGWIEYDSFLVKEAITAIKEALAQPADNPYGYDWSMLEAAQESLREHMARIKELEAQLSQPAQKHVAWTLLLTGEHHGIIGEAGEKFIGAPECYQRVNVYTTPPQRTWIWLSDADIAEVIDTTCQYTGSYEEFLIKKAERKIRSMNHGT
jgi:tetratricopeptide (TPR) repeat protein